MQIFRTKTSVADDVCGVSMKRCLSAFDLILLGIGCIIGTGIFVLTGIAAATLAGPGVVLSFVVAGIACAFAALCYAELAASYGGCFRHRLAVHHSVPRRVPQPLSLEP